MLLENLSLDRLPASILSLKLDFKINPKDENRYAFFNNKGIYIHNLSLSKQPVSLFYQKRELIERYYSEELISVNSAKRKILHNEFTFPYNRIDKNVFDKRIRNFMRKCLIKDNNKRPRISEIEYE